MFANSIHHVYIADGFMDDAEELIHKCLQRQDILDFQSFCIVWKEMELGCLYKARNSGAEIAELSEEIIHIAKHYMLANTSNYEESVAGLFLVYTLLNLQPYSGFAVLRIVPEDIPSIKRLETIARKDRRHDVLYILASVLIKGSHYCVANRERGMDAPIKKYFENFKGMDNIRGLRPNGVFFRQNEELDILRDLGYITKRYCNAKKMVIGGKPADKGLQYLRENLPLELNCSLKKVINGIFDEDVDDDDKEEDTSPLDDHAAIVESIKARAMRNIVNPMRHLVGVQDRKRLTKSKQQKPINSDNKSKTRRVRTNSRTTQQNTPKKRKTPSKGNRMKKLKPNPEFENGGSINDPEDTFPKENKELSDDEEELEAPTNAMNLEIGYLPSFIRTDDDGKIVQIELIDNENSQEGTKVDVIQLKNLPDLNSIETQSVVNEVGTSNIPLVEGKDMTVVGEIDFTDDENAQVQKEFNMQKNRKKTHLKSKFKRMGILPVANFRDPA